MSQVGTWGGKMDSMHLFYLCNIANHIKSNDLVVDLGCGDGDFILKVAAKYPKVQFIGIDSSEAALEVAKASALILGLSNIKFLLQTNPDVLNIKADVVISIKDFNTQIYKGLIDIFSILKNDGAYFLCDLANSKKPAFMTPSGPRAKFFERRRIYHLPLRKLQLLDFVRFLKIKTLRSCSLR